MTKSKTFEEELKEVLDRVANIFYDLALRDAEKREIREEVGCGIAYKNHILKLHNADALRRATKVAKANMVRGMIWTGWKEAFEEEFKDD